MFHSDTQAGGPAASQALSLHEQTLQPGHLLLQALQLRELATVVIQGSHQGPQGLFQPPIPSPSSCPWNLGPGGHG